MIAPILLRHIDHIESACINYGFNLNVTSYFNETNYLQNITFCN